MSEKDQDLLKKVNLIAQAVEVPVPPIIAPDVLLKVYYSFYIDQRIMANRRCPEERVTYRKENSCWWALQDTLLQQLRSRNCKHPLHDSLSENYSTISNFGQTISR